MEVLNLNPNGVYDTVDFKKSHIGFDTCEQIVEGTVQSVCTISKLMKKTFWF